VYPNPIFIFQEYRILINQLEHQFHTSNSFSLQKLWYYIHPHIHTLATLSSLIEKIQVKESPFSHPEDKSEMTNSSSHADFFLMSNKNTVLPRGGALLTLIHNDILVYSGYVYYLFVNKNNNVFFFFFFL